MDFGENDVYYGIESIPYFLTGESPLFLDRKGITRSEPFIDHVYVMDLFLKDMHGIINLPLLFWGGE